MLEECVAAGSVAAYARATGLPSKTLREQLERYGIAAEIKKRLKPTGRAKAARKVGEEVTELERLQAENKELEAALAKTRGNEVAEARVLAALESGIQAAKPTYKRLPGRAARGKQQPHTLALLLSDAHAGEKVSYEETNGLNEYDWSIMLRRLRRLAEGVRSHNDHYGAGRARKLHITSLGDGLSGSIHEELRETNDPPFAEAIVRYGEDIGEWVATELAPEFDEIVIDHVVGNHPRFSTKPRAKVAYDNGDWIAANVTRIYLRGHKHIAVNAARSSQVVIDICGRKVLLVHGDGVRTTMAGVPWGGIIRHSDRLRALFALADVDVTHVFGGHWHNPQVAEDRSILINGSVKGVDEYSIKKYGGGKPPSQLLAAFHPKHGLTGVHFIDL